MKNVDMAVQAIRRAARWFQGAERAMEDGRWDDVVYSSQMAAEHSAKAVLLSLRSRFPEGARRKRRPVAALRAP